MAAWQVDGFGILRNENGEIVGDLFEAGIPRQYWSIVAASLDLLEACEAMVADWDSWREYEVKEPLEKGKAAVAKAQGTTK